MIKNKKRNSNFFKEKLYFIIGVSVTLLVIFVLLIPTKTIIYEVEVPYTTTEAYTEKEPYEVEEAYTIQEPYETTETYTDTVPVERDVPYTSYETTYENNCDSYSNCECTATHWLWGYCTTCSCAVTRYRTEISYEEILKERPVTKYTTVTKYRTVTKYKDVEKTRDVIKTRVETRELEKNWIFGFKVPYSLHLPYISENE